MRNTSPRGHRCGKWIAAISVLAMTAAFSGSVPDARGACDPATDNCASAITSVTDDNVLYTPAGPAAALTFFNTACTLPPCALDNSATALHGTVANSADGTFTYTFNDNSYSGPETITYTRPDNTTATISMTVCAVAPCAISNPTAQIGQYVVTDNSLYYTPDVTKYGQPLTDNLAYTVTDKNGKATTIRLTYVYPTFEADSSPPTHLVNHDALTQPFKRIEPGASYGVAPWGAAWFVGDNGRGGGGAKGLEMINDNSITTNGYNQSGIEARSIGGNGQGGQNGGTKTIFFINFYGEGGDGGWGGTGGTVRVISSGDIETFGGKSHGIWAQSKGGDGGWGGNARGAGAYAGSGSPGGSGGKVDVYNLGNITTHGSESDGVRAESLSGTGGRGGNAGGWFTTGGNGSFGVPSGAVLVDSTGNISTGGFLSHGIFAQSIGGGGGNGGSADGWFTGDAGDGGGAGNGGTVEVKNTGSITTSGNASDAIFAQSVGGGGGGGGNGSGWFAVGGSGVAAGDGNLVTVSSKGGPITTGGSYSNGIFAQSVGGGGGGGGSATAVGAFFSFGLGGNGGDGGDGKTVAVRNESDIHTAGKNSYGILAQSVGGGGGSGGYSIAASAGLGFSGSLSIGGSGAKGGDAGAVSVTNSGAVWTDNTDSHGIFAQSVGGTGGNGGFAIAGAVSDGASLSLSFGGSGGSGGVSGPVRVSDTGGSIRTLGDKSYGLLAQSVGGGGGTGGFSIAGGVGGMASVNFSMAGTGGPGGRSNTVSLSTTSGVSTGGDDSHAVFAQSVGGGGGAGGFSVTGGVSGGASVGASVGGAGGAGGAADNVTVSATGATIHTAGSRSYGILAQSVGGGGGDGGFSVAGGFGSSASVNFAMGGTGGAGGMSGAVSVNSASSITTDNTDSHAIFAQSVGGGGGSGGFSVTGGISGGAAVGAAIGGAGGGGGTAGDVTVTTADNTHIQTSGGRSYGILAQSMGGSGGDGGFSVAGGLSSSAAVNFSMGGSGGDGATAGAVSVDSSSVIATFDNNSHGIFAQSVGGGGGSGGFSVTAGISNSASVGASIGGFGGDGAEAGAVTVRSTGATIRTAGERSYGILAQSMGGTGGDGGFSVAGGLSKSASVNFSMGGFGGDGAAAAAVSVDSASSIFTDNTGSHAIFAQSVGGGGGSGGFSVTGGISADGAAVGASIGGFGGDGARADNVTVRSTGAIIQTTGERSHGILAQSMGGTGGDGGFSVAGGLSKSASVNFSMGGFGGDGASAGAVSVDSSSAIATFDNNSHGIFAQSVGGGGGSGGFSVAGSVSVDSFGVGASIGGYGGGGASSGAVTVRSTGDNVVTAGDRSYGILAQSIGGTGGDGGFSVAGAISKSKSVTFSLGGGGGTGSFGGNVDLATSSSVYTLGHDSHALFAQSLGGSGGSGGFSVAGSVSADNSAAAGVGISIGGFGGGGGNAGNVTVSSTGHNLVTFGGRSYGILAQSVGGGGGDGGFSVAGVVSKGRAVSFSMGGSGGTAGAGGTVVLINESDIVTHDNDSHGVFAQSVGGGGGSGGFSVAGSVSADNTTAAAIGISIGGFGGGGGNADNVTVDSRGSAIVTAGARSYGILAQSVGGGGGDGGFSVAGGIGKGGGATFSLGGFGDSGAHGRTVDLRNLSDIATLGEGSHAIFAQSVGGGGGSGGFSVAGSIAWDNAAASMGISVGGFGAGGGNGGPVSVRSGNSVLSTAGDDANGILAQSIGGGGGNGGFSVAGSFGADNNTKNLSVAVGGFAGDGGVAGNVDVVNASAIYTLGNRSEGIMAQSVGGSGGNGGFAFTGSWGGAGSKNLSFALGGSGGDGNYAGNVSVMNDNAIDTSGFQSHGIFAQSVGGGGGKGGWSAAIALGSGGDNTTRNVNLGVSIGGGGGDGGYGGAVSVVNSREIVTRGKDSHGILAQSIGGGGGEGGGAFSGVLATGGSDNGTVVNASVAVGGGGGDGNYGGTVTVVNSGAITALDNGSNGIFAQSVGGGGGNGGKANTLSLLLDKPCGLPLVCKAPAGDKNNWSFAVAVGGDGGGASHGGVVDVTNHGNIVTRGADSAGIFAQSVGGGGGTGGNGILGTDNVLPVDLPIAPETAAVPWSHVGYAKNWQAIVGGSGGSSGNGDNVTVRNTGTITTYGYSTTMMDGTELVQDNVGSYGIFAQSIGGGGGVGGNAAVGATGKIGIGGGAGSAGDGGAVRVESSGRIETFQDGGHAILAQSGGGGGGIAGDVKRVKVPLLDVNVGLNLAFGRGGGNSGDGGAVTVDSSGEIVTHGGNSFGILAQSFGGGGGLAGNAGFLGIPMGKIYDWFAGSVGGDGDGGAVTVTHTGAIYTLGGGSHGIFAQSAGGKGSGGAVHVAVEGDVLVQGDGAIGIFAQSRGDAGGGAITVDVLNGTVQGGTGDGVGVLFVDGGNNTLTNRGTITTVDNAAGTAVGGGTGSETIHNYGIVTGSVALAGGTNAVNNQAGGTFNTGATVYLGSGNTLTNRGTLSPGGVGAVRTTTLTGNLVQTASGNLVADLDLKGARADRINLLGTADFAGSLTLNLVDPGWIPPGTQRFFILSGMDNVSDSGLSLVHPTSAVVEYGMFFRDTELEVSTRVNFAPAGLTPNQSAIGQAVNAIQLAGGTDAFAPVVAELVRMPGAGDVASAYDQMSPVSYARTAQAAHDVTRLYTQNLLKRIHSVRAGMQTADSRSERGDREPWLLAYGGPDESIRLLTLSGEGVRRRTARHGGWLDVFGQAGKQDSADGFNGYEFSAAGGTVGLDYLVSDRFLAGGSLGTSATNVDLSSHLGEGYIKALYGSLYGSYFTSRAYLDVAFSYGAQSISNGRNYTVGGISGASSSSHGGDLFTGYAEGGCNFGRKWILQPYAGLQYIVLAEEGFSETGAGPLNLDVARRTTSSLVSELGVRLERVIPVENGNFIPELGLSWNHDFAVDDRVVSASFSGARGTSFSVTGQDAERDGVTVGAGVTFLSGTGVSTSLKYRGEFRNHFRSHGILGELVRYEF